MIDYYYSRFVNIVTDNRPEMKKARLVNDYGANVFPAEKALEYGFIDGTGYSESDTLSMLAKEIGIEDDYYQVVKMQRKITLSNLFKTDSPMMTGKIVHKVELPFEFDTKIMNQFLYLYMPGL